MTLKRIFAGNTERNVPQPKSKPYKLAPYNVLNNKKPSGVEQGPSANKGLSEKLPRK